MMRISSDKFVQGNYYHIYNHAAQNNLLFRDSNDYEKCIQLMNRYFALPLVSCIATCLMPNHYHFLLRQNSELPIYHLLNRIWFAYARYYNVKYNGKGSIFLGKMQHIAIYTDNYLHCLIGYIHLNPVKANLSNTPEEWYWSNFRECVRRRDYIVSDVDLFEKIFPAYAQYPEIIHDLVQDIKYRQYLLDFT